MSHNLRNRGETIPPTLRNPHPNAVHSMPYPDQTDQPADSPAWTYVNNAASLLENNTERNKAVARYFQASIDARNSRFI